MALTRAEADAGVAAIDAAVADRKAFDEGLPAHEAEYRKRVRDVLHMRWGPTPFACVKHEVGVYGGCPVCRAELDIVTQLAWHEVGSQLRVPEPPMLLAHAEASIHDAREGGAA